MEEREEIMKYKWIESEKIGRDIGYDKARLEWTRKYKLVWSDEKARRNKF
jgi:hypothetical protein